MDTVGAETTATAMFAESSPPAPVQVIANLFSVLVKGPTDSLPARDFGPLQPPEATHADASAAFHRSVTFLPMGTEAALAVKVTTGTGTTLRRTDSRMVPATPRHASEKVLMPFERFEMT